MKYSLWLWVDIEYRFNNIIIPNFENNFASKYVPENQSSVLYAIISLTQGKSNLKTMKVKQKTEVSHPSSFKECFLKLQTENGTLWKRNGIKLIKKSLLLDVLQPFCTLRISPNITMVLKEINPEYSLEGLMLKLELQNFGHLE